MLFKAFPPPGGAGSTKHIRHSIKHQTLKGFTANCKKAGVTFNSAFEALIDTALVEMLRDAGINEESHRLSVRYSMNIRRFMKRYELPILGFHVLPIVHRKETKVNVRDHFWEYAQRLHSKLFSYVHSGKALLQSVVREMAMPQVSPEELFKGTPPITFDYSITNVGEVSKLLGGEGDHVQLTDRALYPAIQKAEFMMVHVIITFRGCTSYTLSYDASNMTADTAQELSERIVRLFSIFSH